MSKKRTFVHIITRNFKPCCHFNLFSANPTKWSNILKLFVGNLPTSCLVRLTILWGWRLELKYFIWKLIIYWQTHFYQRKLNVHKTSRRCPCRLLNVLCTSYLCPVTKMYNPQKSDCPSNFIDFCIKVISLMNCVRLKSLVKMIWLLLTLV